jgi:hypothetical protein
VEAAFSETVLFFEIIIFSFFPSSFIQDILLTRMSLRPIRTNHATVNRMKAPKNGEPALAALIIFDDPLGGKVGGREHSKIGLPGRFIKITAAGYVFYAHNQAVGGDLKGLGSHRGCISLWNYDRRG